MFQGRMKMMAESNSLSPRDVFALFQQAVLKKDGNALAELYAEDGIHEFPFRSGSPKTIGQNAIRMMFSGLAKAPIRYYQFQDVVIHDSVNPEVLIVEYKIDAEFLTSGHRFKPAYVAIMRIHEGKIAHFRDYEDIVGKERAFSGKESL